MGEEEMYKLRLTRVDWDAGRMLLCGGLPEAEILMMTTSIPQLPHSPIGIGQRDQTRKQPVMRCLWRSHVSNPYINHE